MGDLALFTWWGRTVARRSRLVLVIAMLFLALGVGWGRGVFNELSSGGFNDPHSQSAQAFTAISAEFGNQNADVVVVYSSPHLTVSDPAFRSAVESTVGALRHNTNVGSVVTYYDTSLPSLVSRDRHATSVVVRLAGISAADGNTKIDEYKAVRPALAAPGLTTQIGGQVTLQSTIDDQTKKDITRGEMTSLPLLLILLLFVFGGLAAASMPLLIGFVAVFGAFTTTRLISTFTDVSTFAINTITLLGLGTAIDYSLFVVSRFREELRAGHEPREAVARTMATAGRTVFVSGLTIGLSLSSLLIFPEVFLRSTALGAMSAVLVAMLGAVTVLPALLTVLGHRINALRVPLPGRARRARKAAASLPETGRADDQGAWARLAHSVMRRPVRYIGFVVAVMVVLALPFRGVQFGGADQRVLPTGNEARTVSDMIAAEFPGGAAVPIQTLVKGVSPAQVQQLAAEIRAMPGVTAVQPTAHNADAALLTVNFTGEPSGSIAYDTVRSIRALHVPAGAELLVGGRPAEDVDLLSNLSRLLPWMIGIMAAVTLLLLFLAFGSVLLPVQAVLMNAVSISAAAGVMVWVFQNGHLSGLLSFTALGHLQPNIPVLILATLFGLSTDYEVFLLSRVRETWDATHDNRAAVAGGLQRTGRIITAAALLLILVVIGFSTGEVVFAKMIGIGMAVAIIVDATLVRALLVPAVMRLFGRANWWAPGALAAVHRRFGIHEGAQPALASAPAQPPVEVGPAPSEREESRR